MKMLDDKLKKSVDKWSNSFALPLIPPKLFSNSVIKNIVDDGAKLIYLKFLYGIQDGSYKTRPTDGGVGNVINDLSKESLWSYSLENETIPEGFKEKIYDGGIIGTGGIRKCGTCRGTGKVRCETCGGKVRWNTKDYQGNIIENTCSCGDGKQMCRNCDGFGDVEVIIHVTKQFKLFQTKSSQYTGKVPEDKIKLITGEMVFEQVYDYPVDAIREMLIGGIDTNEFNKLNNAVLEHLKLSIEDHLKGGDIDIEKIHSQLEDLFKSLPNPGKENKILHHEAMPIRVMVRVENAPVKQVDYMYKEEDYSLWIYGKENSIWNQKTPISFNYKIITILIFLLGLVGSLLFL